MSKYMYFFVATVFSQLAMAQVGQFKTGSLIPEFGKIAEVPGMDKLSAEDQFTVSFDVSKQAKTGELNRSLDSGARFLNMHANAGIKPENLKLAFVIHGSAVNDMVVDPVYQTKAISNQSNANVKLIKALQEHGVKFYVCGQSAAYYGVKTQQLIPGVKMSLSAMTAHAQLQQAGYSLNPF